VAATFPRIALPQRINRFPACHRKNGTVKKGTFKKGTVKKALALLARPRHSQAKPAQFKGGKFRERETAPWMKWKNVSSAK
jgi:hypothetical protein